jgi:hypothetical protein
MKENAYQAFGRYQLPTSQSLNLADLTWAQSRPGGRLPLEVAMASSISSFVTRRGMTRGGHDMSSVTRSLGIWTLPASDAAGRAAPASCVRQVLQIWIVVPGDELLRMSVAAIAARWINR